MTSVTTRGVVAATIALSAATLLAETAAPRWTPLGEPGSGGRLNAIEVSPHDTDHVLLSGDMLGVGVSFDQGETWLTSTGFLSYEIDSCVFHPSRPLEAWAATMSGPHRSLDGGRTWQPMRCGLPEISQGMYSAPIGTILFDPNDESRLLAFGGSRRRWASPGQPAWGAVWESRDGGACWTRLATLGAAGNVGDAAGLVVGGAAFGSGSSEVLAAAVDGAGLLFSEDGGATWEPRNRGLPTRVGEMVVASDPACATCFVASLGPEQRGSRLIPGGIYRTENAGRSWRPLHNGISRHVGSDVNHTAWFKALASSPDDPSVLLASDMSWSPRGDRVYVSDDAGGSWRTVLGGDAPDLDLAYPAGMGMTGAHIAPTDAGLMFVADSEHVLRSRDGGRTWQDVMNRRVGDGWKSRGFSGLVSNAATFHPTRPGVAIVQSMDAGNVWLTRDDFASFEPKAREPAPWAAGRAAWIGRERVMYAGLGQHVFTGLARSDDGGETWTTFAGQDHGLPERYSGHQTEAIFADPSEPSHVLAVVDHALYRSTDSGASWRIVFNTHKVHWAGAHAESFEPVYLTTDAGVFSGPAAGPFEPIGGPREARRGAVAPDGTLYVVKFRGDFPGLWRFRHGEWTRLLDEPFARSVAVDPHDPARLALGTGDMPYHDEMRCPGLLLSSDGGATWAVANEGLPMRRAGVVAFDPHVRGRMIVGTGGRGFFIGSWADNAALDADRSYRHTRADSEYADPSLARSTALDTEMLRNGSMSRGDSNPADWTNTWTGAGAFEVTRDRAVYRSAPASLRIASIDGPAEAQAGQVVELDGLDAFTISGHALARGDVDVSVHVQFMDVDWLDAGGEQLLFLRGGGEPPAGSEQQWEPFSRELDVPGNARRVNIAIYIRGDGAAWLDDVRLVPGGADR